MKLIRKILKWLSLPVIAFAAMMIVIPILYEDEIVDKLKTEINSNINASVNFNSHDLSLIRSFPKLRLSLDGLLIKGINAFEADTFIYSSKLNIELPLKSLWQQKFIVNEIKFSNILFNALVLKDGSANWDIMKDDEAAPKNEVEKTIAFQINNLSFEQMTFFYTDYESEIISRIKDMNILLEGMMSEHGIIRSTVSTGSMDYEYEGFKFLDKAHGLFKANIESDSNLTKFTFRENTLHLNELDFDLTGSFAFVDTNIVVNVDFVSESTDFKGFLSMIPLIYQTGFEKIKSGGNYKISGFTKGVYNDLDFPEIGLNIDVNGGWFKYPELKGKVDNIAMAVEIRTGNTDNTFYHIKHLHLDLDDNPIDLRLLVHSTDTDPFFDGELKGNIDLNKIKSLIPLKDQEVSGLIDADIVMRGRKSSIDKAQFDKFLARGEINLKNLKYKDGEYLHPTEILTASLNVSPAFIEINNFSVLHGRSDAVMRGRLDNYLAYIMREEVIKADLTLQSNFIDLNELFLTKEENKKIKSDSASSRTILIPDNIDCALTTNVSELIYDKISIKNIEGDLLIRNGKASMDHLRMQMLGGKLGMNGTYTSTAEKNPVMDLDLDIEHFDFAQTFESFNTIQSIAPISKSFKGVFSMKLKLAGELRQDMSPALQTLNGLGKFETQKLVLEKSELFGDIGRILKSDLFDSPTLSKVNARIDIEGGNIIIKPFTTYIGNTTLNIGGRQGLDRSLNYLLKFDVPTSEFGKNSQFIQDKFISKANESGLNLKLPENISFDILITGTINDPKLNVEYTDQLMNYKDQLEDVVKDKVGSEIEKAKTEAIRQAELQIEALLQEADVKAQKIISEAEFRASQLKKISDERIDQLRKEAESNAKKLIVAAGDNPFKKLAAEEASKKILSETDKKIAKLKQETTEQSRLIVREAEKQATLIRSNAESEGQKIMEKAKNS